MLSASSGEKIADCSFNNQLIYLFDSSESQTLHILHGIQLQ